MVEPKTSVDEHLAKMKQALIDIGLPDQKLIIATVAMNGLTKYGARADQYLDLLFEVAPDDATILMNAFTWKFCETGKWDIKKSMSEVGLASEIFRRMPGVIRSPHPIYSFCAKGPEAQRLMVHTGETCFGKGTPFETMAEENIFCVSLGKEFPRSLTLLHSFEEIKLVPHRFFKEFKGKVDFGDGEQDYSTKFYVRENRDLLNDWTPAVELLQKRGLVRGMNLELPVVGVYAKDLRRVCFELLDENKSVFWVPK